MGPVCDVFFPPAESGAGTTATLESSNMHGQCYLTVAVYNTDFDEEDEFVASTTANGQAVHGRCRPGEDGVAVDADGFFECVTSVALPPSADGTFEFVTEVSASVDERAYEGSFAYVEYEVACGESADNENAAAVSDLSCSNGGRLPTSCGAACG